MIHHRGTPQVTQPLHSKEAQNIKDKGPPNVHDPESPEHPVERSRKDHTLLKQGQQTQGALFDEVKIAGHSTEGPSRKGQTLGYIPSMDALPIDHDGWSRMRDVHEQGMEDLEDSAARPGEMGLGYHMSHNQFGESPRTAKQVQKTTGMSADYVQARLE